MDYPIHVTLCTEKKEELFNTKESATTVINEIVKSSQDLGFRILCYCLMPDHLHVVVSPGNSNYPLSKFLNIFKGRTTTILRRKMGFNKIWQKSGCDHIIRADEDLRVVTEYIMNNPVRKGVVENMDDYPYSELFDVEIKRYI